jgi:hypothetical protein
VTFNAVLSQTLAMLQQHGRVSYRALQRQAEERGMRLQSHCHLGCGTLYRTLGRVGACALPPQAI